MTLPQPSFERIDLLDIAALESSLFVGLFTRRPFHNMDMSWWMLIGILITDSKQKIGKNSNRSLFGKHEHGSRESGTGNGFL